MRKVDGKKGFTLVELSLAVAFLALLSLTIVLIINDTVGTYRRGLTLNQVNTVGMDLVDDMRSAIQNSPSREPSFECEALYIGQANDANVSSAARECVSDGASSLVALQRVARVDVDGDGSFENNTAIPVYGAICTGSYSYIWNSGYFFGENAGEAKANAPATDQPKVESTADSKVEKAVFKYAGGTIENFRLLKIKDDRRGLCKNTLWKERASKGETNVRADTYHPSSYYDTILDNVFDVTGSVDADGEGFVDYFASFDEERDSERVLDDIATNPLALYDLTVTTPVTDVAGDSAFYSASFILGTLTGGINVKAKGNFCKTPEDYDEDFDYCAINKFNFAAQAIGG